MLSLLHDIHSSMRRMIKLKYYRNRVIKLYRNCSDIEKCEIALWLKRHQAQYLNYDFVKDIQVKTDDIYQDENNKLFYAVRNNKKIYFPREWKKETARSYYQSILTEQHEMSPHNYLTAELKQKEYRTVLDIGGAEGVFAIDMLEYASYIYIFEADEKWMEPLQYTFAPYADRVKIIKKYVADINNENYVTLDSIFAESNDIDIIKMDVEGVEPKVLLGAKNVLERNENIVILTCVYHYDGEEQDVVNILKDYYVVPRYGYVLFHWPEKEWLKAPFLRRCVVEARKKQ